MRVLPYGLLVMLALTIVVALKAVGIILVGTLLSFHIDGATGPTIVLVQLAVFIGALVKRRWIRPSGGGEVKAASAEEAAGGSSVVPAK